MNYCKHANFCTQCPLLRRDCSSCSSHKGVLVTDHKNTKNGKDIVWVCNDGRWDWEEIEEKRYECNNECPKYRVIDGKKCVFVCGSWKEIKCPFLTCCRSCCGTCPRT